MTDDDKNVFAKVFPRTLMFSYFTVLLEIFMLHQVRCVFKQWSRDIFLIKKLLYTETEENYSNIYVNLFSLKNIVEIPELSKKLQT